MATELFAASLLEIIPNARFYETKATKLGFLCEVSTPFPISRDYMRMVEEKMKEKIKNSLEYRVFEMTGKNAADFLKAKKQSIRSRKIRNDRGLVSMIQGGEYLNYLTNDVDTDLSKIAFFYFDEIEKKENMSLIRGYCFADKDEMKNFKRRRKIALDHLNIGVQKEYIKVEDEKIVWLEKGLVFREKIITEIVDFLQKKGFQRIHRPLVVHESIEKEKFEIVEVEGEFEGEFGLKDRFSHLLVRGSFPDKTYLLQLREELGKISPFNSYSVEDPLGLIWELITIEKSEFCIWVDRWIALMWEKGC